MHPCLQVRCLLAFPQCLKSLQQLEPRLFVALQEKAAIHTNRMYNLYAMLPVVWSIPSLPSQVSVSLPAGTSPLQLADKRGRSASIRASGGFEALQAEFSASNAVVTGSDRAPAPPEVIEDEVFENERAVPGLGFKAMHLLPLDPQQCALRHAVSTASSTALVCSHAELECVHGAGAGHATCQT